VQPAAARQVKRIGFVEVKVVGDGIEAETLQAVDRHAREQKASSENLCVNVNTISVTISSAAITSIRAP
jgi:hypothetical protein